MTWLLGQRPLRSILVTRLRYLGDVVMSTVLLAALRAGDPDLNLGYLCEQSHGVVLADHPCLDRLHLLSVARSGADAEARQGSGEVRSPAAKGTWGLVGELRRARYDLAVDLFFNPRSAWLLRHSGIPARIGGAAKWRRHLYTHTVLATEVRRREPNLEAIAPGGLGDHLARLAPLTHAESGQDFLSWLAGHSGNRQLKPHLATVSSPTDDPYLVLAPGATWPSKEWPQSAWVELVARLAAGSGPRLRILVPPGRDDLRDSLEVSSALERVEILPTLGLASVKDLLGGASALVTVDGGVMHMGVALGVPTVALFGPTDPAIWFPYEQMGPYRVVATAPACHPCDLHQCDRFVCLPDLAVESVTAALATVTGMAQGSTSGDGHG